MVEKMSVDVFLYDMGGNEIKGASARNTYDGSSSIFELLPLVRRSSFKPGLSCRLLHKDVELVPSMKFEELCKGSERHINVTVLWGRSSNKNCVTSGNAFAWW
eukprot:TRINITY_DN17756_c0_g1_i18.p1 TRINITY_DN17756_c0_g1~~TRINITY_DN17756_c0_g1_i18.p1  ORF type:complete len:103 (-),score=15.45 TRINITY_DN17756_c0_g1_i18:139-447(-)